jgi:DNA-binding MarR family transcriptional regulator
MEDNNYILLSLNDEKSKAISEVLGSSTCKKIINYMTEVPEASQKDLSDALKIPLNTVEYNIKKLLTSGLIQKRKNFFWSKKGKKIIMYELSNKSIIISHKRAVSEKIKSIMPAFILTLAGSFALWTYGKVKSVPRVVQKNIPTSEDVFYAASEMASDTSTTISPDTLLTPIGTPLWLWFLIGSLIAIFIISIVNWRKL